jgi:uridine kinase
MSLSSSLPSLGFWKFDSFEEEKPIPRSAVKDKSKSNSKTGRTKPFIIGVAGGTASGKTSVCEHIITQLDNHRVDRISLDSFYLPLTQEQMARVSDYNWDHPAALDWDLIVSTTARLAEGKRVEIPVYDFVTNARREETQDIYGVDVLILEGILTFHDERLRNMLDMKIFVDTDADMRLARRVVRDMKERGRTLESILHQYETFVKPSFDTYVFPTKKYCDVIIPRGKENLVAIDLIVQHINIKLREKQRLLNVAKKSIL